jgi:hypothetical protein
MVTMQKTNACLRRLAPLALFFVALTVQACAGGQPSPYQKSRNPSDPNYYVTDPRDP